MGEYVLNSSEFLNEDVYCKLKTYRWYSLDKMLKYCVEKITGYRKALTEYNQKNNFFSFDVEYAKENGEKFDVFGFYGIKSEFVETDRGDKFVLGLDDSHGFVFYPMCKESVGGNKSRLDAVTNTVTDPRYGYLVMYAYAGGKSVKIDREFSHYYLSDSNFTANTKSKDLDRILSEMEKYVELWGFASRYREMSSDVVDLFENTRKNAEARHAEEKAAMEKEIYREDVRKRLLYDGADMTISYKGNVVSKKKSKGGSYLSIANVRLAFSLNAKFAMEYARENGIHPDTTGMTNLENSVRRNAVYTERNLPKDHYELVDCYRTHAGEVCEHCGKDPIVNVMVIRNPKGEIFHVGNECVSHLVDIPQEEFEDEWNAPFKEAVNMMAKVRNDKNKGVEGIWYTYKDKCFYVIENKPMFDYELFGSRYVLDDFLNTTVYYSVSENAKKKDLSYKVKDVGFMKHMLPRWYAGSIEVGVNVGDLIEMLYNGKQISFGNFTYDGVKYKIPTTDNFRISYKDRLFIVAEKDFSVGEYSQKFEDAWYGLKNVTYRFGDVEIEYKWNTDEYK